MSNSDREPKWLGDVSISMPPLPEFTERKCPRCKFDVRFALFDDRMKDDYIKMLKEEIQRLHKCFKEYDQFLIEQIGQTPLTYELNKIREKFSNE